MKTAVIIVVIFIINFKSIKAQTEKTPNHFGLEISSPVSMNSFYKFSLEYGISAFFLQENTYLSAGIIKSIFDATNFNKKSGYKFQSRYYLNSDKKLASYATVLSLYSSKSEEWTKDLKYPNNEIITQTYLGKYQFWSFLPGIGMSLNVLKNCYIDVELLYGIEFYNYKSTITRPNSTFDTIYYKSGNLFAKNRSIGLLNFSLRWKPTRK